MMKTRESAHAAEEATAKTAVRAAIMIFMTHQANEEPGSTSINLNG
jgi:hypothetical protein